MQTDIVFIYLKKSPFKGKLLISVEIASALLTMSSLTVPKMTNCTEKEDVGRNVVKVGIRSAKRNFC